MLKVTSLFIVFVQRLSVWGVWACSDGCRASHKLSRGNNNNNDNNNNLYFFVHIFGRLGMAQLHINKHDLLHYCISSSTTQDKELAIYTDTQDVQPNNSHYMNSITHVYRPAWLLMGAVKQTLISQFVRTLNDQCWGQFGCNSMSTATSLPTKTVILMLTVYVSVKEMSLPKQADTAPINNT